MTQAEFDRRMASIKAQEAELGVKIEITDLHDKDHLRCDWYGGVVGTITFPDEWKVLIEARGDIRLYGVVDGEEINIKDKSNGGRVYDELKDKLDDASLKKLLSSDGENFLQYDNNNWFEFNVESPDGQFHDMGMWTDNVLDDDLLACFEGVEGFWEDIAACKKSA